MLRSGVPNTQAFVQTLQRGRQHRQRATATYEQCDELSNTHGQLTPLNGLDLVVCLRATPPARYSIHRSPWARMAVPSRTQPVDTFWGVYLCKEDTSARLVTSPLIGAIWGISRPPVVAAQTSSGVMPGPGFRAVPRVATTRDCPGLAAAHDRAHGSEPTGSSALSSVCDQVRKLACSTRVPRPARLT